MPEPGWRRSTATRDRPSLNQYCRRIGTDRDLRDVAGQWLRLDPDVSNRTALESLLSSEEDGALREMFSGELVFGTAGIRAPLGPGPLRMNGLVVARVSLAVAAYLLETDPEAGEDGVVVGWDGRRLSGAFARIVASSVLGAGLPARLLPGPLPTPLLAFEVRHSGFAAGVMVTASHNPAEYNGLKVYERSGAQILSPVDGRIADLASGVTLSQAAASLGAPHTAPVLQGVLESYVSAAVSGLSGFVGEAKRSSPSVVHTAMHGVGAEPLRSLFSAAGLDAPVEVPEQEEPDPTFPSLPFPNPEEPGALDLATAKARSVKADLVLATDPDADRLAVSVRSGEGYETLTGDQLGALLGSALIGRATQARSGAEPVVATTVVSSSMLRALASYHGVRCVTTLTGFKWLARAGEVPGAYLLFGYEEAMGYSVLPGVVADKDGLSAALAVRGLAVEGDLLGSLDDLYRRHGVFATSQVSLRTPGSGPHTIGEASERIRRTPPRHLAGREVTFVDLSVPGASERAEVDLAGGRIERSPGVPAPAADVIVLRGDDVRVLVRPSGTEPKLKIYLEATSEVRGDLDTAKSSTATLLAEMESEVREWIGADL